MNMIQRGEQAKASEIEKQVARYNFPAHLQSRLVDGLRKNNETRSWTQSRTMLLCTCIQSLISYGVKEENLLKLLERRDGDRATDIADDVSHICDYIEMLRLGDSKTRSASPEDMRGILDMVGEVDFRLFGTISQSK